MKKSFWRVLLVLSLVFIPRIYAFELGVSSSSDYLDGAFGTGQSESVLIAPNQKSSIAILYGDFQGDGADLGKIEISINGASQMNLTSVSSNLESGDTISGSGGNYTVTINSASDDYAGEALFVLTMPNATSVTTYNVSATARSYDKNNSLISTKNISIKYNVIVKNTGCDNNYNVNISTSAGTPEKTSEFLGKNYSISTSSDTIDVTLTPESSKTEIYYDKECTLGTGTLVKQNSVSGYKLNYGNQNMTCFLLKSECFRQWESIEQGFINDSPYIIGGSDWYDSVKPTVDLINIAITRVDNRSKINTLKSLSISNITITFNPDLKTYMGTVPYKVSSVKIDSTLTDPKSSYVKGYGNRTVNLKEGNNDILIKVKAENGAEATYTIKVTREKNDDATLKKLLVNDIEVTLKSGLLVYNVFVENDVTKAIIKAEPNDTSAKVEIGKIDELQEGSNSVNITVTASNGKKNLYVLNITRDLKISKNAKLKSLIIKNHTLNFNPEVNEYTIEIDNKEDQLEIEAIAEHPKAKVLIIGNKKLNNDSEIKIKVTAEDEETVINYNIKIVKKGVKFNVLFIIIPLIAIGAIVYLLFNKNKLKNNVNNNPSDDSKKELTETENIINIDSNGEV